MRYGQAPKDLGIRAIECLEMMAFQYLPIKLRGTHDITREARLSPFDSLIGASCCDYIADYGLGEFIKSHVYLTAKHLFQGPGCSFNRTGWHCDGFLTDDVNYVWSSCSPTIFNISEFSLTPDDSLSMREMNEQANPEFEWVYPNRTLLRMDQFVVHRVSPPESTELRTFFKLSISKDRYDLEGNSRNYLLDYSWPLRKRSVERNMPQEIPHEASEATEQA